MRDSSSSDLQLINRVRTGDQTAFRELVERYQRRAFSVANGIVRDPDEALNICQEGFLRAFHRLDTFDGESQFFTWFYRIIHNLAIDHIRRRRACVNLDDVMHGPAADPHVDTDPAWRLASNRLRDRLALAFDSLTPAHRAVVTLREIEGLSYREIADAVECSIGTVMSRLFHARKRLQRELHDEGQALGLTG